MDGKFFENYRYRLRSSGLTPVGPGNFIIQTFGVDRNKITVWPATTTLPITEDFTGASTNGQYISASFQRLPFLGNGGKQIFSGQIVHKTEFLDESDMPGGSLL